jgi:oligopeptide/dipeptide ABC transporter ATP-binding protein
VVGESGSGKSVTALSVMRMVPSPGQITGGQILFEGKDLLRLGSAEMRHVRGGQVGMVPQNPLTSLNPVSTVETHFREVLKLHGGLNKKAATERAVELLRSVGIPDPAKRVREYPHRLSGGQRQRVIIALAMACQPRLLIADEPTTALDVTIQAQILELIDDLVDRTNIGAILITHNLGIVAKMCDQIAVMYAGRVVEKGQVTRIFNSPAHPYTKALLNSIPRMSDNRQRLMAIEGQPPDLASMPPGCAFAPRCPMAFSRCHAEAPPEFALDQGHTARCWLAMPEVETGGVVTRSAVA